MLVGGEVVDQRVQLPPVMSGRDPAAGRRGPHDGGAGLGAPAGTASSAANKVVVPVLDVVEGAPARPHRQRGCGALPARIRGFRTSRAAPPPPADAAETDDMADIGFQLGTVED